MKKLFIAMAAFMAAFAATAQETAQVASVSSSVSNEESANTGNKYKADEGSFGVVIGYGISNGVGLFGGASQVFTDGSNAQTGTVDFDYKLSDNWAVRLGIGFDHTKDYGKIESLDENGKKELTETTKTHKALAFRPGAQYLFNGTERLEPYVGAELLFGGAVRREAVTKDKTDRIRESYFVFGANAFTGFNIYFSKNIYVGAEVGFGFDTTPTGHITVNSETANVNTDNLADSESRTRNTNIGFAANSRLRLGWKF